MADIDFGPVLLIGFIIFYIIPGLVGFTTGFLGTFLWLRKKGKNIGFAILRGIFVGFILLILFPVVFHKIYRVYAKNDEKRHQLNQKIFISELPNKFKVESVSVRQNDYLIKFTVPKDNLYTVVAIAYQGSRRVAYLNNRALRLKEGINDIVIPAIVFDIDKSTPVDLEIKLWSEYGRDAYLNTRKQIIVTNSGGIEVYNGIKYFSPAICSWQEKHLSPCSSVPFSNLEKIPYISSEKLRVIPE